MRETVLSSSRETRYHVYMEKTLRSPVAHYTTSEKALKRYTTVVDVFDYGNSSECVTPLDLALHQTPTLTPDQKILVPAAGIGTYVLAALIKGAKPENITAVEINPAYADLGDGIFGNLGVNYVLSDFVHWQTNMKFDVVIGNPPFQKGGYSAFYTQFFRKTRELLKKGGFFSLVSPSKAAAPCTKGYKELSSLGWNAVEYGVNDWFPNIDQPIAIYSGRTKDLEEKDLLVRTGSEEVTIKRGTVLPVQYINPTKQFPSANIDTTLSIFKKFFAAGKAKVKARFETLDAAPLENYVYLAAVAWRYHPLKEKGGPYGLHAKLNDHDKYMNGKFLRFSSEGEASNMAWLLSKSLVYRFVAGASCRAKFLPKVLLEETPDLSFLKTDEEVFSHLKLTSKEIAYLNTWNQETNTPGRKTK